MAFSSLPRVHVVLARASVVLFIPLLFVVLHSPLLPYVMARTSTAGSFACVFRVHVYVCVYPMIPRTIDCIWSCLSPACSLSCTVPPYHPLPCVTSRLIVVPLLLCTCSLVSTSAVAFSTSTCDTSTLTTAPHSSLRNLLPPHIPPCSLPLQPCPLSIIMGLYICVFLVPRLHLSPLPPLLPLQRQRQRQRLLVGSSLPCPAAVHHYPTAHRTTSQGSDA